MRAVHVDTIANTYSYQGSTNPSVRSLLWDSTNPDDPATIELIPVSMSMAKQECLFCTGSDQGTMLSFSPLRAENADTFVDRLGLLDLNDEPLDESLYRVIPPEPVSGRPFVNAPLFVIQRGVPFQVVFTGKGVVKPQRLAVRVMRGGSVREVLIQDLNANTAALVEVSNVKPEITLAAYSDAPIKLRQTIEWGDDSFAFTGWQTNEYAHDRASMRVDYKRHHIIYADTEGRASIWDMHVSRHDRHDDNAFRLDDIAVGQGDRLVLDYSRWTSTRTEPSLWLDKGSDGTLDVRLPLRAV